MLKQIDFNKMPITDIVNEIIYVAAEAGSSDIHFDPTETTIKVRFRIDGMLIDYTVVPESVRKNLVARLKIISGMDITESRLPQDGAIKTIIHNLNLDMRVSSLPTNVGEKIVIRILDYSASSEGLESLGFEPHNLEKMKNLIKEPNGIILVTGATGSGKSTTVYSLLQILNTPEVNLVTVEDPVEMNIDGINQIQVNSEIGLTFASVLRSILRQDPDIIMIGEIRDDETAKIAVRASITGHLVLSTIHTNNALSTIERLTDMDVERYLLASSLNGIVSQKLARRICPHCMKKRPAIDYERKLIKVNLGMDVAELSYAEGCPECVSGYKGRIALHEVLVITQEIRDAIANGMSKENLRKLVYKGDTTTLLQDGLQKVIEGKTTIEEVLRVVELDDENAKIVLGENSDDDGVLESESENAKIIREEIENKANSNIISNITNNVNTNTANNNVNTNVSDNNMNTNVNIPTNNNLNTNVSDNNMNTNVNIPTNNNLNTNNTVQPNNIQVNIPPVINNQYENNDQNPAPRNIMEDAFNNNNNNLEILDV